MDGKNTISRRGFLSAVAALGSLSLAGCGAQSTKRANVAAADRTAAKLPERGEFVVRGGQILTMDPALEIYRAATSTCAPVRSSRWGKTFEYRAAKLSMAGR
jgi:anaerobic selenocysteine-containing dehydrogenase